MATTNKVKYKKKKGNGESQHPISIPAETVIEGYIKTKKPFRIECKCFGTIMSSQKVVIAENSKIIGDVICKDFILSGEITGNIFCSGQVQVQKGAKIKGKVYTQLFQNEEESELDCIIQIPDAKQINSVKEMLDNLDNDQPLSGDDILNQIRNVFYNNVYGHKANVDKPLVNEFTEQLRKEKTDHKTNQVGKERKLTQESSPSEASQPKNRKQSTSQNQ